MSGVGNRWFLRKIDPQPQSDRSILILCCHYSKWAISMWAIGLIYLIFGVSSAFFAILSYEWAHNYNEMPDESDSFCMAV
jgi:hypothetical protein